MKIFAERLRELRLAHGLTIEQAALELQINPSTLRKYERCIIKPRLAVFFRIADFYEVRLNWLFGRE